VELHPRSDLRAEGAVESEEEARRWREWEGAGEGAAGAGEAATGGSGVGWGRPLGSRLTLGRGPSGVQVLPRQ